MTDFFDICRDEKCPIDEIHDAHGVVRRGSRRGSFFVTKRQLILEAAYTAISDRVLKPFAMIYTDVLDDYGRIKERTVYRALAELVAQRRVASVGPSGTAERLREGGFIRGGYVRYDSPLLWTPGGIASLIEQADDLKLEMSGYRKNRLLFTEDSVAAVPYSNGTYGGDYVARCPDAAAFEFAVN